MAGAADGVQRSGPLSAAERRTYELGRQSYERGDTKVALRQLGLLLRSRRGFADVHYMVGTLLERRGDHELALRSLREALRLNPNYIEAMLALASIHERQGDYEQSRALAERAKQAAPPSVGPLDATTRGKLANLQARMGDVFREAGELGEAIESYRKALDRCPRFHDIRCRLGVALREAGLPDRALAEFRRVLRDSPDYLDAAVQLGITLYSLGRGAEAVAQWRGVLARDPQRSDARMYLRLVGSPGDPEVTAPER